MKVVTRLLYVLVLLSLLGGCAGSGPEQPRTDDEEAALNHLQLGIHYMRQGRLNASKDNLERSLRLDNRNPMTHATIALLYEQLNDFRLAERHYRRALRLDGDDPSIRNNYGTFLCRRGDYREAEEELVRAARNRLYETPEVAWTNAGSCVRRIPDYEAAESHFRNALRVRPNYTDALWSMADMQYEREEYLSARAFFQRLAEQDELEPAALYLGVRIEDALGDRMEARRHANRLKSKYPDSEFKHRLAELGYD
ncbi:type IV pilus biogenesis/stability protein PilW [Natronospira bacteriovora]|uniref:Type IV pilus biogenesis/stability protein PilW n=1 Tax=Natronospira bacteriovora TaxID=3069753 RepID=A0ABU0W424_9GAMM|nr:type IV pilus biogenesis/stability protein PilW [Natronospira sp. AB-CW4]MDQ2068714.1 type IV pilus biogenesis/stability protein PilW [Natronospira sp. AB-CW4]